ncbi:MAG: dephospho-CoA kinase [Clostridia bacterium]|nr:dephospho-CoA kinase [Clostridia bacterium]
MIIWLTGGSGSGKSVLAAKFEEYGYKRIDADKIAREIVLPEKAALAEIVKAFGEEYLLPDGKLDRKKLGRAVFGDGELLSVLNRITHKYIIEEMVSQSRGEKNVIYDAPLRNTFGVPCDKTLLVTAPKEIRIGRIMERDGIGRTEAENRLDAQSDNGAYLADADAVIQNDGDVEALFKKADIYIKEWYTN